MNMSAISLLNALKTAREVKSAIFKKFLSSWYITKAFDRVLIQA